MCVNPGLYEVWLYNSTEAEQVVYVSEKRVTLYHKSDCCLWRSIVFKINERESALIYKTKHKHQGPGCMQVAVWAVLCTTENLPETLTQIKGQGTALTLALIEYSVST